MAGRKRRKKRRGRRRGGPAWTTTVLPFALLGLALVGGFIAFQLLHKSGKEEAVCALVIDRTSSVSGSSTVNSYRELADRTINGCSQQNAGLYIYAFDQAGSKVQLITGKPFDLWGVGNKSSIRNASRAEQIGRAQKAVSVALASRADAARGSDIVTAVKTASENLNNDALSLGVKQKYLVVLTDGIQSSDDISLAGLNSGSASVTPIVNRVRELGLLPSLDGTKVSFAGVQSGVNTKTGEQLPQLFEAKVKDFWTTLVHEGNGHLCTYVADSAALPRNC